MTHPHERVTANVNVERLGGHYLTEGGPRPVRDSQAVRPGGRRVDRRVFLEMIGDEALPIRSRS